MSGIPKLHKYNLPQTATPSTGKIGIIEYFIVIFCMPVAGGSIASVIGDL